MRLMVICFTLVLLIVIDQARFNGHYTRATAHAISKVLNMVKS